MAEFWTTSGLDLLVETQRSRRRASLEDGLRQAIESGRLAYGSRLPSSRSLAEDLGWSRGTVTAAYDQLISDGYLHARQGSATVVGFRPERGGSASGARPSGSAWRYDLRPGTTYATRLRPLSGTAIPQARSSSAPPSRRTSVACAVFARAPTPS
jgi:GntR family transcriptional regulator/MocR family aminotransferase